MADRDTIIEAMARAMEKALPLNFTKKGRLEIATAIHDAALPLIRNAALEEAAKTAEHFGGSLWPTEWHKPAGQIAAAIRARKDTP